MSCTARTARRRRRQAKISKKYRPHFAPSADKSSGMKGKGKGKK